MPVDQIAMFGAPRVEPAPVDADVARAASQLPESVRLGTSSWSFPGWKGRVWDRQYPDALLSRRGLEAYAAHPLLRTVSVDRSYYRMPPPEVFEDYAAQVPAGFRFIVKAPAALTTARLRGDANPSVLDAAYAEDEVFGPLQAALGDKLGHVLLQFPPQPADAIPGFYDRLARVLAVACPLSVEVRTPELLRGPLAAVLRDTGANPCLTLHPSMPDLRTQWRLLDAGNAPELVVRWNLSSGQRYEDAKQRYAPFDRLVDPDVDTRGGLARAIDWGLRRDRPVWITANNKAEGCAPATLESIVLAWAR